MATTDPTPSEELDSPSDVLVIARAHRADADRAEADVARKVRSEPPTVRAPGYSWLRWSP
ncbi:MAG TPA: hypothetical protein VFD59_07705 [Nocardioidaceae bacterium]|nr:hypothetical protein [Nocardioidaceae bacterium]